MLGIPLNKRAWVLPSAHGRAAPSAHLLLVCTGKGLIGLWPPVPGHPGAGRSQCLVWQAGTFFLRTQRIFIYSLNDTVRLKRFSSSSSTLKLHFGLKNAFSFIFAPKFFFIHLNTTLTIRSDQISHSVVSYSLRPHESQHTRPPCPSPTPRVHSDSCPSSQ